MSDAELIRRAEAAGISASYLDWRDQRVQVPDDTLVAILDALGSAGGSGDRVTEHGPAVLPEALPRRPRDRAWGFAVQLYSVRSRQSWGHGDFPDLADLATWSARELGAAFLLVNPLHAAEPVPPVSDSPYLPMTRYFVSPLYLRIEDVPEYQRLSRAKRQEIAELAGPLKAANRTPDLIDRNRVLTAKRAALGLIRSAGMSEARRSDFEEYKREQGDTLADWANWCALAEVHGPDWRRWPADLADPRRVSPMIANGPLAGQADFHAWLQWLADQQLAAAQRAALAAGMSVGLIADLAVGVHPGGADAWARQDLLVRGISVGAPPDGFNQRGQDWTQPPVNPRRLVATQAKPFADLLCAASRHAGGLRIDHVMGLMRLWWVPEGRSPDQGAYVSYDHRLTVGTLSAQAAQAGVLAIGEDLGTVEPWIQHYLDSQHILGTEMAWFARQGDGSPLPPSRWRRSVMATVGTHDVPPIAGFVAGDQVTVRARLGLLSDAEAERAALDATLDRWHTALAVQRLLPPASAGRPTTAELTVALYGYLALTPSVLTGVALVDAVGDRRTQNIPGTSDEYPNWRIPLCDSEGAAVLIEELGNLSLVNDVVAAATSGRRRPALGSASPHSRSARAQD